MKLYELQPSPKGEVSPLDDGILEVKEHKNVSMVDAARAGTDRHYYERVV